MSLSQKALENELSKHFMESLHLSPLESRIYSFLLLCPKPGHTFDEIVENSESSKSSVSTALNRLLDLGKIEFFTKEGERKRYFKLSKNYLESNLRKTQKMIMAELDIFKKVQEFSDKKGSIEIEKRADFRDLYTNYSKYPACSRALSSARIVADEKES